MQRQPTRYQGARMDARTAPLWRALADPTRRRILDLLLERPRITGEVASHFRISRIAVMRHLTVLSDAGLVASRKRGRERRYYLNAMTLQQIHRRWFDPLAAGWVSGILRLRQSVEASRVGMEGVRPAIDIAFDVRIGGSTAAVFSALTTDAGGWWGHPMLRPEATGLTLEPRVGGLFIEEWSNGGAVLAAVTQLATDRQLELTGPFHLDLGIGIASFELAAAGKGTLLRFSFRAFGPIDADRVRMFSEGWRELLTRRLKALVEQGTRLGIAPKARAAHKRPGARRRSDG
ncbi:MAG: metalloregulator ArsR/SmtB family transcription factor [Chloroflexi bacterium]|nr:MAG: metalloregulator ArsR/SmtB family transcription factor [Chloroflexota bacterium]